MIVSPLPWLAITLSLLVFASSTALRAEVDAREIVRRAVAAEERNWKIARNYGFSERVDARRLDAEGGVKSKDVKLYDVTLQDGSPYRRLTGRDDRALPPGDEKKEQDKLARSIAERRKETAPQRARRLAEYEGRPDWQREAWNELPEAFDFRLTGEAGGSASPVYMLEATPRQGYRPQSRTAGALLHLSGKLWIDKQDYHLAKAEVEVIDIISVGLFLVRLAKGSRAVFEQTRVNEEVWLPRRTQVFLSARLGLLKVLRYEQEVIYSNVRQFPTGSPVASHLKAP